MEKNSKVTLHYFNARGQAELARLVLTFARKQFEDHRIEHEDWPHFKNQTPNGSLPYVEFTNKNGKTVTLSQSSTIVRQLAIMYGLGGKTFEQAARADEAFEALKEVINAGAQVLYEKSFAKKANLWSELRLHTAPPILSYLEKQAKENGGKNLAGGDGFTYADITLAMLFDTMTKVEIVEVDKLAKFYPNLSTIAKTINENADMKAYLAKRPETNY